jgi:hypothetical protein
MKHLARILIGAAVLLGVTLITGVLASLVLLTTRFPVICLSLLVIMLFYSIGLFVETA